MMPPETRRPARPRPAANPKPLTWLGGEWHDGAWLHPVFATAGVVAAGELVEKIDAPWWALAGIGATTALGGFLSAAGEKFAESTRAFTTAAGISTGAWLTCVAATNVYSPWSMASAVAGLILATTTYPRMRHAQIDHEEHYRFMRSDPRPKPPTPAPAVPLTDEEQWVRLFARLGFEGMRFNGRDENRAGFSVRMSLPANGKVKFTAVAAAAESIEIAAAMPCDTVRIERGRTPEGRPLAGEIVVHFDVRNILAERIDLPDDDGPLTVNEAFVIGMYTDGQPIALTLREVSALIAGVRGRGKSNLFNVIVHQLSRCIDVVLWGIDLKGGRAIKPWLQPWLDGKTHRPVFDWVATTRMEAHLMLRAFVGVIQDRAARGAGSKMTPSREQPAIFLIIDELAALVGQHSGPRSRRDGQPTSGDNTALLTLAAQLGRSECADVLAFTQRATVTMSGGGDFKSQLELRIGMGVTKMADANSIFESNRIAAKMLDRLKDPATRGAMIVDRGADRVMLGKSFLFVDGQAELSATRHARHICALPKADQDAADRAVRAYVDPITKTSPYAYTDRWSEDRAGHLYLAQTPVEVSEDDLDAMEEQPGQPPTAPAPTASPAKGGSFFTKKDYFAKTDPAPRSEAHQDVIDAEWEGIVAAWEADTPPAAEPEQPGDVDRRTRMVEIVREAGTKGTTPGQITATLVAEGLAPLARTSLYPWLRQALDDGVIVQPSGPRGRYYTPEHAP